MSPRQAASSSAGSSWLGRVGVALAVVLIVAALGLAAWRQNELQHHSSTAGADRIGTTVPSGPPTTVAPTGSSTTTPPSSATTLAPFTVQSANSNTVNFTAPAGSVLTISTQGTCWIVAHQTNAQGPVVFAGNVPAGQSKPFTAPISVQIGDPSVAQATGNGAPLSLPARGPITVNVGVA